MLKSATLDLNSNLRPQSLIFTLFGDYIRHRSERVWVGTLVKLLALFDVSEPAVRSAVSRMTRRDWLKNQRDDNTSYYALTPESHQIISEGAERIFHFPEPITHWDSCWHLVTYSIPEDKREGRDFFRNELVLLGFGNLTNAVWVSPRDNRARVQQLVASLNLDPFVQMFYGQMEGQTDCSEMVARCWNLATINCEYSQFIEKYGASLNDFQARLDAHTAIDPSEYFVRRFMLMHEYRRFPYRDPQLPNELLPHDWHGAQAATLFHKYHDLLAKGANQYFDSVFR